MDNQTSVIPTEDHLYCSPLRRYLYARAGELPTEEQIVAMEAIKTFNSEGWTTTAKTTRELLQSIKTGELFTCKLTE